MGNRLKKMSSEGQDVVDHGTLAGLPATGDVVHGDVGSLWQPLFDVVRVSCDQAGPHQVVEFAPGPVIQRSLQGVQVGGERHWQSGLGGEFCG